MRKTLILLTLLAGCAKEGQNSATPATSAPPKSSRSIDMNDVTCGEIMLAPHENYAISSGSDKKYFILSEDVLYSWNLKTGETAVHPDGEITLAGVCTLTIENGVLSNVVLIPQVPQEPSCGGFFQTKCLSPIPVQQPYVCGPNGEMCY